MSSELESMREFFEDIRKKQHEGDSPAAIGICLEKKTTWPVFSPEGVTIDGCSDNIEETFSHTHIYGAPSRVLTPVAKTLSYVEEKIEGESDDV